MRDPRFLAAFAGVLLLAGGGVRLQAAQPATESAPARLVVFEDFTRFT
jgi:hypothetical protein